MSCHNFKMCIVHLSITIFIYYFCSFLLIPFNYFTHFCIHFWFLCKKRFYIDRWIFIIFFNPVYC